MARLLASIAIFVFAVAVGCHAQGTTTCNTPGAIKCDSDCQNVVLCLGDRAGGYIEESVEICDADASPPTACSSSLRKCSSDTNSCDSAEPVEFECTHAGQFPHPTDCTKFYFCIANATGALIALSNDCEAGYAYNSTRNICNLPLTHRTCVEGPVPVCQDIGESGPTIENRSIYYICKRKSFELYPVLYLCTQGGDFNNTSKECDDPVKKIDLLEL